MAAARELLDRGYGRPLQMIDASIMSKKLTELRSDEIEALEAGCYPTRLPMLRPRKLMTLKRISSAILVGVQSIERAASDRSATSRRPGSSYRWPSGGRSTALLLDPSQPRRVAHDKQCVAFETVATEVLFVGAAGGGKIVSDAGCGGSPPPQDPLKRFVARRPYCRRELCDTALENCRAQTEQMPAFPAPSPWAPARRTTSCMTTH